MRSILVVPAHSKVEVIIDYVQIGSNFAMFTATTKLIIIKKRESE